MSRKIHLAPISLFHSIGEFGQRQICANRHSSCLVLSQESTFQPSRPNSPRHERPVPGPRKVSTGPPCPGLSERMYMKTILVTGGCGFIGSNFLRYILDREPAARLINLDALTYAGNPENVR